MNPIWRFSDAVSASRQAAMAACSSYQAVVVLLQQSEIQNFVWDRPYDEALRGCERTSFRLRVTQSVYDAFFNSPVGYRAQFARSAKAGYESNFEALDALESALISFARVTGQADERLVWSLRAPDSKIWIDESEVQEQLGQSEAQILYEPWRSQSEYGAGLLAPIGELLEVKGAWVDRAGRFKANPKKRGRAEELHRVGFS